MNKSVKRGVLIAICAIAACGVLWGVLTLVRNASRGNVNIYAVSDFSMSDYWGDTSQTSGTVSTDEMQKIYTSNTQQVKEVLVEEGQSVKKGDKLLTYDTTLTSLDIELADIAYEKQKLQQETAEKELARLELAKNQEALLKQIEELDARIEALYRASRQSIFDKETKPIESITKVDKVEPLASPEGDGSLEKPLYFNWNSDDELTPENLAKLLPKDKAVAYVVLVIHKDNTTLGEIVNSCGLRLQWVKPEEPTPDPDPTPTPDPDPTPDPSEPTTPTDPTTPTEPNTPTEPTTPDPGQGEGGEEGGEGGDGSGGSNDTTGSTMTTGSSVTTVSMVTTFIQSEGEDGAAEPETKQTVKFFPAKLTEAPQIEIDGTTDEIRELQKERDELQKLADEAYPRQELVRMIRDKIQEISDLDVSIKLAALNLEKVKKEAGSDTIYSELDGVVKAVRDPDEASTDGKAVVEVSGGGGYYITGALSELELDTIKVGEKVQISSWMTGASCEGEIVEISDYPTDNANSWSDGNSNVSYYPFKVFVSDEAQLQEGDWVEMSYQNTADSDGNTLYLESMFIRSENGKSYVMARGENGRLEKRWVQTGRNLWGSYTQIRGGLTTEDFVAFPYGRDVVEGAGTTEATSDQLYNGM